MCRFKFLISELLTSSAEFFATLNGLKLKPRETKNFRQQQVQPNNDICMSETILLLI